MSETTVTLPWWRSAVIYQIYLRSFADGNGDGVGDLAGVRAKLPYLAELGVDALWFNPWYCSPMADGGYDVADYRQIDPSFGTLAEAEKLISEALDLGIRTIIDIVPNHTSNQHAWFEAALAAPSGSPERARYWFRAGRGESGELPPNDWASIFGGRAWSRTTDSDGNPGEWYLHLFASEQPDLNWRNPEVCREHEDVIKFWLDRGAAGIRIDSAAMIDKDPALPDFDPAHPPTPHPHNDREEVHEIYRSWRTITDSYPGDRVLIGEVWVPSVDAEGLARYLGPDQMHAAFNFDYLTSAWDATRLREIITGTLASHADVDAPATWVLANHDVTRTVTRYGREVTAFGFDRKLQNAPTTDFALGVRRARAAALLSLALPGSVYIYQGEELGLPEVEDLPATVRQDPMFLRTDGEDPGRDGCRVPLPWEGAAPPYGFSEEPECDPTWLPQPSNWAELTVQNQRSEPASMLHLYRQAIQIRREQLGASDLQLRWLEAAPDVLAFERGTAFQCIVNFSSEPVPLPDDVEVLLASTPCVGGLLSTDAAVWFRSSAA